MIKSARSPFINTSRRALCVLVGAAAMAPVAAFAEEGAALEEIVVTAQRRAESLQDVPIAVTAVTSEALSNAGVDVSRDLPQMVPSVQFTRSGPSGLFFLRGVGTTNAAAGEEGANAFYVDGVYQGALAQTVNHFNNVERVEVIKGPQGTLFGRNATGGLVHVITQEPGDELVVSSELGYSNYDTYQGKLYVGGPLSETVSMDVALTKKDQGEGWGRNLTVGKDIRLEDYTGARSKLVIRPSDELKFTLAGNYFDVDENVGIGWTLDPGTVGTGGVRGPGDHDTTANNYSTSAVENWGLSFTAEADLGFADFTSITAKGESAVDSDFDVDSGPLPLVRIVYESGMESFQQEFRLASAETDPFSWQVGAFYYHSEADNDSSFLGAAFTANGLQRQAILADLETDSYAVFSEGTYAFTDATKLTLGVRYTKDEREFDGSQSNVLLNGTVLPGGTVTIPSRQPLAIPGVQQSGLNYDEITWRAALQHELSADASVYASVNRGFKAGSYSLQNPLNDPFEPQEIIAYEIGLKSEFLDNRLRLNVAAYHYDIDDYQVRSAAVSTPGTSLILNAATVKVDGVDVEFELAATDELRLFGGVTVLDSTFDEFGGPGAAQQSPISYPNYQAGQTFANSCLPASAGSRNPGLITGTTPIGGYVTCLGNVSGNHTPNAPELTASFGGSYIVPVGESGEVRMSLLYSYNDGYFFEADNNARQDSYDLINSSVEYRPNETFGVELWGSNLTDELYAVQKITTGTGVAVSHGAPRTYGVTLKYDY